jgi:hypothetical protein
VAKQCQVFATVPLQPPPCSHLSRLCQRCVCCRSLQGRRKHRFWEPVLEDPRPLLEDVTVVLVSPKRPISVGTVARSLSCFECCDLRLVDVHCDHLARSSRNGSKGAQYLLWQADKHATLASALADVEFSVACTRWVAGRVVQLEFACCLAWAPKQATLSTLNHGCRSPQCIPER